MGGRVIRQLVEKVIKSLRVAGILVERVDGY